MKKFLNCKDVGSSENLGGIICPLTPVPASLCEMAEKKDQEEDENKHIRPRDLAVKNLQLDQLRRWLQI